MLDLNDARYACRAAEDFSSACATCVDLCASVRARPEGGASDLDRYFSELDAVRAALDRQAIVAVTDRKGVITAVNDLFCRISGYTQDELIGRTHRVLNAGHHPRRFFVEMWRTIGQGLIWRGEIRNRAKDGRHYWVDTTIVPHRGRNGAIEGYVSVRYDITDRKDAEAALEAEANRRAAAETLVREILDAIPDGVAAFDPQDRLVLSNRAFRKLYGSGATSGIDGRTLEEIVQSCLEGGRAPGARRSSAEAQAWLEKRSSDRRKPGRRLLVRRLSDGRWLQIRERRSPSGHIVSVFSDVTALKQAELTMRDKAGRDPLTGLFNRAAFSEHLERLLGGSHRARPGALVVVDVDGFKAVNDAHGHDAGDALLATVAQRLVGGVRRSDVVARLGGDEFAMILPGVTSKRSVETLLGRILASLGQPVDLPGRTLFPRVSLGCAFFPEHGATAEDALKAADLALYQAKADRAHQGVRATRAEVAGAEASAGGLLRLFAPALRETETRRRAIVAGLRDAILRKEIEVHFQPKVSLRYGGHVGFEALARWSRPDGEAISPKEFIPAAENANLIGAVGAAVLEKALTFVRRLMDAGLEPGSVAVNVAAAQIKDAEFVDLVGALLARHRLAPDRLEVEITETVLLDRASDEIAHNLARLRQLGVAVSLDDFGTGYASLAHLRRFPVDTLKIDRSFVEGIESDAESAALVRGIIDLAHGLCLGVVAEGIETPRQRIALEEMGCDIGQGYLFAAALPPKDVPAYLRRDRQRPSGGGAPKAPARR